MVDDYSPEVMESIYDYVKFKEDETSDESLPSKLKKSSSVAINKIKGEGNAGKYLKLLSKYIFILADN